MYKVKFFRKGSLDNSDRATLMSYNIEIYYFPQDDMTIASIDVNNTSGIQILQQRGFKKVAEVKKQ